MVLQLQKKTTGTYAQDASSGTLSDISSYGGSNPLRNTVANFIKVYKSDRLGNRTEVTVQSYDPEIATEYTYTIPQDGWFQARFVSIPYYSDVTAYVKYDVVYDSTTNIVYRATQVGPTTGQPVTNPGFWEVVSDPVGLVDNVGTSTASGNLSYQIFDYVATPNTRIYAGDAVVDASSDCCGDCERSEKVLIYELFYVLLDGMTVAEDRLAFAQAEKHARKAQEEFYKL